MKTTKQKAPEAFNHEELAKVRGKLDQRRAVLKTANEKEMEKYQRIHYFESHFFEAGIAFRRSDGQLVEYGFGQDDEFSIDEITLAESALWLEKMLFAQARMTFNYSSSDHGVARWLRNIAGEL